MFEFVLAALVVAGGQMIYAMVGFGAGMFSVALLALLLPDLRATVATLMILTFITELGVLMRVWRSARVWLLIGLVPTTALGLWIGTQWLAGSDVAWLKRALGGVVIAAGVWFLFGQRKRPVEDAPTARPPDGHSRWWAVPVGLVSGVLAGLFGTGGPPVIVLLRAHHLDKGAFRATLLWFFLIISLIRGGTYYHAGLLDLSAVKAAAFLLPASLIGVAVGMVLHHRLSERAFAIAVALLLVVLGALLLFGVGR